MIVKILGSGCMNCTTLEKRTREALTQLDIPATVEKVQDIQRIIAYGILSTPGLVIDEKVVVSGRVPTVDALKELIVANQKQEA